MATTFPKFSSLPFELRALIWEQTVEPRTVKLCAIDKDRRFRLFSPTPIPAPLQTCREARNHGLYKKAFEDMTFHPDGGPGYIWLNLDIDIIDIGSDTRLEDISSIAPWIQRLGFMRNNSCESWYHFESRALMAKCFAAIKEIHVDCADGFEAWHGASEDHSWPCGDKNVTVYDSYRGESMTLRDMEYKMDRWLEEEWRKGLEPDDPHYHDQCIRGMPYGADEERW